MGVVLTVLTFLIAVMQGVFSKTWGVTMPKSIVSISNSCVTVPCHFEVPDNQEANVLNCSSSGIWRKGSLDGPIILNQLNPFNNIIQGQIVGDLTKKNCTTVFYTFPKNSNNMYFFRLECPNPIKYNFQHGVLITFKPVPDPPIMPYVGHIPEGARVTLRCSTPVSCSILPPSLTWLPRDSSRVEVTEMLQSEAGGGQWMLTSSVTFNVSADHHNQSITCSVSYQPSKGGGTESSAATQRLNVLYAPRFTTATLKASGPVPEGHTVMFTCSSDSNPPVSRYTWYRDHGTLTKLGQGETLVLQVSQKDSGVYLCEAQSSRGSHRSRPVLLEVSGSEGSRGALVAIPYVICGVVLVLYILTVVVDLYKYQSLSRRLKQIELKSEHTYTDLKIVSVNSDYDQLQLKTTAPPESSDYENSVALQAGFKNRPKPNKTEEASAP